MSSLSKKGYSSSSITFFPFSSSASLPHSPGASRSFFVFFFFCFLDLKSFFFFFFCFFHSFLYALKHMKRVCVCILFFYLLSLFYASFVLRPGSSNKRKYNNNNNYMHICDNVFHMSYNYDTYTNIGSRNSKGSNNNNTILLQNLPHKNKFVSFSWPFLFAYSSSSLYSEEENIKSNNTSYSHFYPHQNNNLKYSFGEHISSSFPPHLPSQIGYFSSIFPLYSFSYLRGSDRGNNVHTDNNNIFNTTTALHNGGVGVIDRHTGNIYNNYDDHIIMQHEKRINSNINYGNRRGVCIRFLSEAEEEHTSLKNFDEYYVIGCLLIGLACIIAVSVGTGGGGLFVPVMTLVMGISIHQATAMSQSLMCGGTLAALLLNGLGRHPYANRPLIDLYLVLLLGPMQIAGAMLGVIVNKVFPAYLIIAFMMVVFAYTSVKTYRKGKETYRKNKLERLKQEQEKEMQMQQGGEYTGSFKDEEEEKKKEENEKYRMNDLLFIDGEATADNEYNNKQKGGEKNNNLNENDDGVVLCNRSSSAASSSPCIIGGTSTQHNDNSTDIPSYVDYSGRKQGGRRGENKTGEGNIRRVNSHHHLNLGRWAGGCDDHMYYLEESSFFENPVPVNIPSSSKKNNNNVYNTKEGGVRPPSAPLSHDMSHGHTHHHRHNNCEEKGRKSNNVCVNFCLCLCLRRNRKSNIGIYVEDEENDSLGQNGGGGIMVEIPNKEQGKGGKKQKIISPVLSVASPCITTTEGEGKYNTKNNSSSTCSNSESVSSPFFLNSDRTPSPSVANNNCNNSNENNQTETNITRNTGGGGERNTLKNKMHIDILQRNTNNNTNKTNTTSTTDEKNEEDIGGGEGAGGGEDSTNLPSLYKSADSVETPATALSSCTYLSFKNEKLDNGNNLTSPPKKEEKKKEGKKEEGGEEEGGIRKNKKESKKFSSLDAGVGTPQMRNEEEEEQKEEKNEDYTDTNSSNIKVVKKEEKEEKNVIRKNTNHLTDPHVSHVVCTCGHVRQPYRSNSIIVKHEQTFFQVKWLVLIFIWAVNLALTLIRGGKDFISIVEYCGGLYWMIYGISIGFLIFCSLHSGISALRLTREKINADFLFVEGDIKYNCETLGVLWVQTFIAGIIAGVLGIGGGVILGPMMLHKGVPPQVVTAVNALLVLLTSSSAAFSFTIGGQSPLDVSLVLFAVCFISVLIGKFVVDRVVKKYNLSSLLIFLMLAVILLSMVAMLVSGIMAMVNNKPGVWSFRSPC